MNPAPPSYSAASRKFPRMRVPPSSCPNVSSIPRSLAPPQPKQRFVGLGFSSTIFLDQRHARMQFTARAALPLAKLRLHHLAQNLNPAGDPLFVEAGKSQPQSIRLRILMIEISSRHVHHSTLARMNQQFARIKSC